MKVREKPLPALDNTPLGKVGGRAVSRGPLAKFRATGRKGGFVALPTFVPLGPISSSKDKSRSESRGLFLRKVFPSCGLRSSWGRAGEWLLSEISIHLSSIGGTKLSLAGGLGQPATKGRVPNRWTN